jgi:hypothetical protein
MYGVAIEDSAYAKLVNVNINADDPVWTSGSNVGLELENSILKGCSAKLYSNRTLPTRGYIKYNLVCKVLGDYLNRIKRYSGGRISDITSSDDPGFVSLVDFHLKAGSKAIDRGNPAIKDPDGSRSDMGAYGGPSACILDSSLKGCR